MDRESGEIDMTADSDDGLAPSESGMNGVEGNDKGGKAGAVDLAAGISCTSLLLSVVRHCS